MQIREVVRFLKLVSTSELRLAWRLTLKEIRRRVYSDELVNGFQFDLARGFNMLEADIPVAIRELTSKDIPLLLNLKEPEMDERELRDVVIRLLLIQVRLPTCYVGITPEDHPCCMCWLIRPDVNDRLQACLGKDFQLLQPREVLLENIFTHRGYRGNRLMKGLTLRLFEQARREGAQRAIAYIREGNEQSLAAAATIGWELFVLKKVRWRMFRRQVTWAPVTPIAEPYSAARL